MRHSILSENPRFINPRTVKRLSRAALHICAVTASFLLLLAAAPAAWANTLVTHFKSWAGNINTTGTRIPLLLVAVVFWLASAGASHGAIINQPMTGTTAPGWVFGGTQGLPPTVVSHPAILTAGAPVNDGNGNGWLRLTDTTNDEAGYAYYSATPFDMSQGIIIQFDYATWGGTGADGYSVYLFDAAQLGSFNIGASGGSLGYAQKLISGGAPANVPGISGGYVGIGVDEFGNFASGTEGRYNGPGTTPSTVTVRGPVDPAAGTLGTTSYPWIATSLNKGPIAIAGAATRPVQTGANYRKVVIRSSPAPSPVIDVWIQFGANQPLTQMIYAQPIGAAPPAQVVIGYAASTGGSTNNHEIRNLIVDNINTDIDLSITNTPSSTSIAPNNTLVYTVVARNNGPNSTTANGTGISVTIPPQLTGVTWSCTPAWGAVCGAGSIAGNALTTSANLPFNSTATYTITGTVAGGTLNGTVLNSTATLTPPAGIIDYNPNNNTAAAAGVTVTTAAGTTTISGIVYSDVNHNGVYDAGDALSTGIAGVYVAAIPVNGGAAICSMVQADTTTGAYTINNVPINNTYNLILTNNACSTTAQFPNANWVYTSPGNYTYSGVGLGSTALTNQNFGVFNGTLIAGRVFQDDGAGGGTANNGILDGLEVPMQGVTLTLSNNGAGSYATTTTDGNGQYALYVPWGSAFTTGTVRITQTFPSPPYGGYINVNYNKGNLSTVIPTSTVTFNSGGRYINFTNWTRGLDVTGINFGNVPDNSFGSTPQAQNSPAGGTIYYAHTFTPASSGSVTFTVSHTSAWTPAPTIYYDSNCSGTYSVSDPILATLPATLGAPICLIVKENVAVGATAGQTDATTVTATMSYTNSPGPVTKADTVVDTTTVIVSDLSKNSTKTWQDTTDGTLKAGNTLRYTITLVETNGVGASNVSVTDTIPAGLTGFNVVSYPAGATNSSTPSTGPLNITNITVPAFGSVTIVFDVQIAPGTPPGTIITNIATITNTTGTGTSTVTAPTVTVSGSAAGSGNKPLYLYDATSTPARKLSRTISAATGNNISITAGTSQTWTMNPVAANQITISPPSGSPYVPVSLYLGRNNTNGNRDVTVTLQCSSGGTILTQTQALGALTNAQPAIPTVFNLTTAPPPWAAPITCGTGAWWVLTVNNLNTSSGPLRVYPVGTATGSHIDLPATTVINVDSIGFYNNTYALGGTAITPPVVTGTNVYIRAQVSDPFGSYDIFPATGGTAPTVTVNGNTYTMTLAATGTESPSLTKIFEYGPITPATAGNWSISVKATEGTENLPAPITNTRYSTMPVVTPQPNLTVLKYAFGVASGANAKPGVEIPYSITVSNTGPGVAGNVVVVDCLSIYSAWTLGTFAFADGASPLPGPSGLSLTNSTMWYSNDNGSTWSTTAPTNDGTGHAPAVTCWKLVMDPTKSMNASPSSFTLSYQAKVK